MKGKEMSESFASIDTNDEEDCNCWEEYGELCQPCEDYAEDQHTDLLIGYYQEWSRGID